MSEAVTIAERYSKATSTSNLTVQARCSGDADMLIAAGWADSLGVKLYRLAGEFDRQVSELRKADTQSAGLMVLNNLKTLAHTRIELHRYAKDCASRWGVDLGPEVIAIVVGRSLAAWLDPNCPKCGGTGTVGGYDGKPANVCRRCAGTGKTRHDVGKTDVERYFAHRLMASMDAKVGEAEAFMRARIRA